MQVATCKNLCFGLGSEAKSNTCVVATLAYTCTCTGTTQPDLNQFTQTVPYFKCSYNLEDCKKNCKSVAECAVGCENQYKCVAQDPPKSNATNTDTTTEDPSKPTQSKQPTVTFDDSGASSFHTVQTIGYVLVASVVAAAVGLF